MEILITYATKLRRSIPDFPSGKSKVPSKILTHYYKLPYIGPFSNVAQNRIRRLLQRYCHNLDIKLVFSSF